MEAISLYISIVAVLVSLASFFFAYYHGKIQTCLEFERIRHSISKKLLSVTQLLANSIKSQINQRDPDSIKAFESITSLATAITDAYLRVSSFQLPWYLPTGYFTIEFEKIKSQTIELEQLSDQIIKDINSHDWDSITKNTVIVPEVVGNCKRLEL